jgi:DNA-directed RNA polymerase subunit RPC12/RpoP
MPVNLPKWFRNLRRKRPPEEVYVDSAALPSEPEGPYRARHEAAAHRRVVDGMDVSERDVVTGQRLENEEIGCPCGHRWHAPELDRLVICPNCGRAVLVEAAAP